MSLNKDLRIANELENTIVMQPQVIQQDLDLFQPQQQQVNVQVHEHKNFHKGQFEPTKFMERLQARNSIKKFKVKSVPEKSALLKAYKGKAVNISAEVRAQKIKNKRSRLFVKAKNSDAIFKAHNDILELNNKKILETFEGSDLDADKETVRDLSYFMSSDNATENKSLFDKYQEEDRSEALDIMTGKLLDMDVSKISLENDAAIAKNAATLEQLSGMVSAYDRIIEANPQYRESLDNSESGKSIKQRIEMLRSIATYYVARKELITDEYYRSHYNDELTLEVNANSSEDEKRVAAKLMTAHYASVSMMRSNGASQGDINKRGTLNLKSLYAKGMADQAKNVSAADEDGLRARKKLLMDYYKSQDHVVDKVVERFPAHKRALLQKTSQMLGQKEYLLEVKKPVKAKDKKPVDPEEVTTQNMKAAMQELLSFDMKEFKFSSYKEAFENYDHNLALSERADKCQKLLARGVARGIKVSDETMLQIRTRIIALNEVRETLTGISAFLKADGGNMAEKDFDKWDEFFKGNSQRSDIAAIPCDDMNQYLKRCYVKLKQEQENAGNERSEYHKTAVIEDYKRAEETKLKLAKNTSENFLRQYAKEHPGELGADFDPESLPKMVKNYLTGKPNTEQLRLIKLYTGNHRDDFFNELYGELKGIGLTELDKEAGDIYLKNYGKNKLAKELFEDISEEELNKFKERYNDKKSLKNMATFYNDAYLEYKESDEEAIAFSASFKVEAEVPKKEQDKRKWLRDAEKAFESILSVDVGGFSFTNLEELFSKDRVKLRHIAELGSGLEPVLNKYKEVLGQEGGDKLCAINALQCEELTARVEFFKAANKYYSAPENILEVVETDKTLSSGKNAKSVLDEFRSKFHPNAEVTDQDKSAKLVIDDIQMRRFKDEYDLGSKFLGEIKAEHYKKLLHDIKKASPSSVGVSINKLNSVLLMMRLPAHDEKGRTILEGTCNLISSLYVEVMGNLKNVKEAINERLKYDVGGVDYKPLLKSLDDTITQCQQDSLIFADKAITVYEGMAGKKIPKGKEPRWVEVLLSARSEEFDTDREGVEVKKGGEGLSDISIIKNADGKTIFFRSEDKVPDRDIVKSAKEMAVEVLGTEETEDNKFLGDAAVEFMKLTNAYDTMKLFAKAYKVIEPLKKKLGKKEPRLSKVISYSDIAKAAVKALDKKELKEYVEKASEEQLEKLGRLYAKSFDLYNKVNCCFAGGSSSADIKPGRNLSNRHVATSRLAQILGIGNIVSESRTAEIKVGNNVVKGNLMEESGGEEIFELGKKWKDGCYSNEAVQQTLTLQVFDYICGQVDRHFGNFHAIFDEKTKTVIGIKAIDNDLSFGNLTPDDLRAGRKRLMPLSEGVIWGLPAQTLNKILALNENSLRVMMGDLLEKDEIDDLVERAEEVKKCIRGMCLDNEEATLHEKTINGEVIAESVSFTEKASDEKRAEDALKDICEDARFIIYNSYFHDKFAMKTLKQIQMKNL